MGQEASACTGLDLRLRHAGNLACVTESVSFRRMTSDALNQRLAKGITLFLEPVQALSQCSFDGRRQLGTSGLLLGRALQLAGNLRWKARINALQQPLERADRALQASHIVTVQSIDCLSLDERVLLQKDCANDRDHIGISQQQLIAVISGMQRVT